MDDAQIIELYFERSERAIAETSEKYGRLCESVAYKIIGIHEDAEECVNDTYLNVWNAVPPKRPENFRAFICKITRNLSLSRVKYNSAKKRCCGALVSFSELEGTLSEQAPFFEDGGEALGKAMSDFLRTQSTDTRNVFMRRYWFLESIEDIAKRFGFSQSKVKSLLFRTRERLKKYLEKEGFDL